MDVFAYIKERRGEKPLHFTLIDPDKQKPEEAGELAAKAKEFGTDAIMVGGTWGDAYGDKLNPWEVAEKHQCASVGTAAEFVLDLFLQGDLDQKTGTALLNTANRTNGASPVIALRRFTHSVVTLPEFHLA